MNDFIEFSDNGIYYIYSNENINKVITIANNGNKELEFTIISDLNSSNYQAFYIYKDDDNNYLIQNINSLYILGVEKTLDKSNVFQKKVNFNKNYKWKIKKSDKQKVYFIELVGNQKRLDILNNYLIIDRPNNSKQSQRFKFKRCLTKICKSDLWYQWEKYELRNMALNKTICVIRSSQNENEVFNLEQNGMITLKQFTGEENQLFYILKNNIDNKYSIVSYKGRKYLGNDNNTNLIKLVNLPVKYLIKLAGKDRYDMPFYYITNFNRNLNLEIWNNNLKASNPTNDFNQKFYFSSMTTSIFYTYIIHKKKYFKFDSEILLKFNYITKYSLDCFKSLTDVAIDKNTRYVDDNVFKDFKITRITINIDWINKFNKTLIKSISFNDNLIELDLNLFQSFPNLTELSIPLSVKKLKGSHEKSLPKLKDLVCSPHLLQYFPGIQLESYSIVDGTKNLNFINKINPLINIKANILIMQSSLQTIQEGFFDYLTFNKVICDIKHIKFLNKNITTIIVLHDKIEKIPSNTFVNFTRLKTVLLPNKLKSIESKAFINCIKLSYIKIPDSVTDIQNDSFYNCNNLKEIKCKPEIKERFKKHLKIKEDIIVIKKNDLSLYNSITSLEIPYKCKIEAGTLKVFKNLKAIKCNPAVLRQLPLNENNSNNIVYLIIQNKTEQLTRNMFEFCKNLIFISIPLSVNYIEPGCFDNCPKIRVVQCNPIFLDVFNKNYITSLLIPEGVNSIFFESFYKKKHLENLQNLYIPRSVTSIDNGTFNNYKKIINLNCDEKWDDDKYFPFRCEIKEGTITINRKNFREWFNLKTLIIPNTIKTIYPLTFSSCLNIEELSCSPIYFPFLYVKNVKILVIPEGVERIEKDDFKNFINLIYLKLPDSLKFIDEKAFDNTPCLNFENISDHPLIHAIKRKNLSQNILKNTSLYIPNIKKNEPLIDLPNYNFENISNEPNILNMNWKCDDINSSRGIFIKNQMENNIEKKERTVEDLVSYDKSNGLYAPYIELILKSINIHHIAIKNGNGLQGIAFKLTEICLKICQKSNFKFKPRPVQLLAILRLANSALNSNGKGSIGEIKTGEGKSFIVSTLAILLCQYDKKVDIITSNIELASRDQKDQEENFKLFGISSGVLFKEEEKEYLRGNSSYNIKIEKGYDLKVFDNQIVYSTNSNFEFVYLNSMFISKPYRPFERKYDIVIVDEVDNMFIDQGTSPAMISKSCNVIHYRDILSIIYYNRYKSEKDLQINLDMIFKQCAFFDNKEGYKKIKTLKEAALASDRKIRNIDYIIEDKKVIIIDSNTGLKKPKTKWSQSIHEMVEIKEGFEPDNHSVTFSAVTQHDFFNMYNKILGVTGTIGTEKDKKDLKKIYGVEIFKAPRHFIKEKKINCLARPYGSHNIFKMINEDINANLKKGRPILVIMNSILSVDDFISQTFFNDIHTIKGIDPINDENSRNVAGEVNAITIATSAAGRGVDIKVSEQAKKNGGLHVIIPFLMPNQRALEQAAGRCGRQGQPGTCNIYMSEDDYYIISKPFDQKEHNLWVIQNELKLYLHKYNEFLFNGKGEKYIQELEIPYNSSINEIMKICAFRISKEKLFNDSDEDEEKKRITVNLIDLLMDMIKISWGFFFNELTHNPKCEDLFYCRNKLNGYLKELEQYIPKNITNIKEELEYLKKLFNKFNWLDVLIIGFVTIAIIGLAVVYFPEALPALVFGTIEMSSEILEAMNNNERINWAKIFLSFTKGCLDGIIIQNFGVPGAIIGGAILNPIDQFLRAKIDGKNYDINNVFDDALEGVFEGLSMFLGEAISKPVLRKMKDFIKCFMKNPNLSNKKIFTELSKILGNPKVNKKINKCSEILLENILADQCLNELKINKLAILEVLGIATQNNLAKDSLIENIIFNKEEGDDDDEEDNKGLEKGISSDFLQEILQKLSEKFSNKNVSKRLKNLKKKKN